MRGILLAAGRGTRLYPMTGAVSKHLLPVYDKPMFYYPLCTLLQAGIRDILIITNPSEQRQFEALVGDGARLGVSIEYAPQHRPAGIADALLIAGERYDSDRLALILGDNLFTGDLRPALSMAAAQNGAAIFVYPVGHPSRFGVAELKNGRVASLEEKPDEPKSDLAVPGLYFYPQEAIAIARSLRPSARGELEITDVNREFLRRGQLFAHSLPGGCRWLDTGTCEGLLAANNLIAKLQREGQSCGCIELTAYEMGFIGKNELARFAGGLPDSGYGALLRSEA